MNNKNTIVDQILNKLENIEDDQITSLIEKYNNVVDYKTELNINSNIRFFCKKHMNIISLQKVGDKILLRYESTIRVTKGPFNLTSTSDSVLNKKVNMIFETLLNRAKELYKDVELEELSKINGFL